MAQQTTQFPPGGQLLNWTPGFSLSGSPIRGIRIDNPSGSWLSVQIPSLPVQYVQPYTLSWAMTLLTPLSSVTVLSGGPPNSQSSSTGDNVTVYAYSESVGDSNGNQYYTPTRDPLVLFVEVTISIGIGPIALLGNPVIDGTLGSSYKLYQVSYSQATVARGLYNSLSVSISTDASGLVINRTVIGPGREAEYIPLYGTILPISEGIELDIVNGSSRFPTGGNTYNINCGVSYAVV